MHLNTVACRVLFSKDMRFKMNQTAKMFFKKISQNNSTEHNKRI